MKKYKIRKALKTRDEMEAVYQLIKFASLEGSIISRSRREIREVLSGFFVAVEDGGIVGCCALEVYNKKLAELRSLVVLSEYKGKGIGRAMVMACIKEAKRKKIMEVITITDKDVFFEKAGFSKVLRGQWAMFVKF